MQDIYWIFCNFKQLTNLLLSITDWLCIYYLLLLVQFVVCAVFMQTIVVNVNVCCNLVDQYCMSYLSMKVNSPLLVISMESKFR